MLVLSPLFRGAFPGRIGGGQKAAHAGATAASKAITRQGSVASGGRKSGAVSATTSGGAPAGPVSGLGGAGGTSSVRTSRRRGRSGSQLQKFWYQGALDPEATGEQKLRMQRSGDAWPACLLRLKSFGDLWRLWHVCLKEKNFLLSERQYARSMNCSFPSHGRLKKVKLTMKRILTVLSRREIHQQALRAKELLSCQQEREIML